MNEPVTPPRVYLWVYLALMVLLAITLGAAAIDLGRLNAAIWLAVAAAKAALVVLYFMDVRHGSRMTRLFVAAGLLWFCIMLALTLTDFLSRGWRLM